MALRRQQIGGGAPALRGLPPPREDMEKMGGGMREPRRKMSITATFEGTRPMVDEIANRAVVGALLTLVTGDQRSTLPGPTGTRVGRSDSVSSRGSSTANAGAGSDPSASDLSEGDDCHSVPLLGSGEIITVLDSASTEWQFNAFRLCEVSPQSRRPLSTLGLHLMSRCGVVARLRLNERRLARFLLTIESGYLPNPYHNATHAADVLQSAHKIWLDGGIRELPVIGDVEILSLLLGAAVHDYEHSGYNNAYLVAKAHPWALTFNDESPNENHHLSAGELILFFVRSHDSILHNFNDF